MLQKFILYGLGLFEDCQHVSLALQEEYDLLIVFFSFFIFWLSTFSTIFASKKHDVINFRGWPTPAVATSCFLYTPFGKRFFFIFYQKGRELKKLEIFEPEKFFLMPKIAKQFSFQKGQI